MKRIVTLLAVILTTLAVWGEDRINIWEGTPVKSKVWLTPFPADKSNDTGISIIVCPGGSYFWHDYETEGEGVARWLQTHGISAYVLQYRVGGIFGYITHYRRLGGGNSFPYPIQDAQRAIQLLREDADRFGVNPDKLGIIGFSAGGHLSMYAGISGDRDYLKPLGIDSKVSLMPSFCAPIYPVVTLSDERYVHKRSRRALMNERRVKDLALRDSLSLEKNIHPGLPPVFLMNCVDDPIVKYQNSELLDSALTANAVPHIYIQYKTGGHGFGASDKKGSEECRTWREKFLNWVLNLQKS